MTIQRGDAGDFGVELDVLFCGVCHGDVDYSDDAMGVSFYPIVPGHEIAGIVTKVGIFFFMLLGYYFSAMLFSGRGKGDEVQSRRRRRNRILL